jgi:succinate dehydrogenase / fumarate reductase cytochrome b subunit
LVCSGLSRDRFSGSRAGWWAWLLQRITGLGLVFYLFTHIIVISTAQAGADTFDDVLAVFQTPVFVVLDLFLAAAVLYHGLNGVRVILIDLGVGVARQAELFWACLGLTAITMAAVTYFSFPLITRG